MPRKALSDSARLALHFGPAHQHLERELVAMAAAGQIPPCGRWQDDPPHTSDDPALRALAVLSCQRCPLIEACRAAAEETGERFGVWGGVDRSPASKKQPHPKGHNHD